MDLSKMAKVLHGMEKIWKNKLRSVHSFFFIAKNHPSRGTLKCELQHCKMKLNTTIPHPHQYANVLYSMLGPSWCSICLPYFPKLDNGQPWWFSKFIPPNLSFLITLPDILRIHLPLSNTGDLVSSLCIWKLRNGELCPSLVPEKHRGFLAHATCEPGAGRKMWRQNVETYINRSQVFKVAGPSQNFGIISSSSIFIGVARIITYPFKKHLKHLLKGLFWKTPNIQRHLFYRTLPGLGRHSPGRAGSFSCQKVVSAFHNVK